MQQAPSSVNAKFVNGPYEGLRVQMKEVKDCVLLPMILNTSAHLSPNGVKQYSCQAIYELRLHNDYESHYYFAGLHDRVTPMGSD